MICVTYYIERILIFSCVSLQVILGSPERIEPILEEPGSTVVHLTSSEKHLLYTDSRGQVTTTSKDTLKAVAKTVEFCSTAGGYLLNEQYLNHYQYRTVLLFFSDSCPNIRTVPAEQYFFKLLFPVHLFTRTPNLICITVSLRIRDIVVRILIRGSLSLTSGSVSDSGSGSEF
jgi:hypothetical protein